jgi:hypothetical protein
MNGKTSFIETPIFGNDGHQQYSGFGVHQDSRKAERNRNRMEARNVQRGIYLDF